MNLESETKVNRFDLEQQMLSVWAITEDIKLLNQELLNASVSNDEISNVLSGISTMMEWKCQRMFNTFETMIKERNIL